MRSSRVYEPIYTVKYLYNDFIILQDVCFPYVEITFYLHFYMQFDIINKLIFMT